MSLRPSRVTAAQGSGTTACVLAAALIPGTAALAASASTEVLETERLWLSGAGPGSAVAWEFRISAGRGAGRWTTIGVPSQWELAGFGTFAYGFEEEGSHEEGHYRRRFEVPESWAERRIRLVFEGVMTDCEVRLNGRPAGPPHQGGFTRFAYDVTELLRFEEPNLLEVLVRERSRDASVNQAERAADYWVFGGIYRPVYLEAVPRPGLDAVRLDARHDGRLRALVSIVGEGAQRLQATLVERASGRSVHRFSRPVDGAELAFEETVPGIQAWSAEAPWLYEMRLVLHGRDGARHRTVEVFGFRSFEVRAEGLFVNERRVLLKGINRHSFWPSTGRALDPGINRRDAELIKGLNANAVRTSHYPPDREFLRACDELGLYVIDELPGWHDAYDLEPGRRLVREMVARDHNHPAVVVWANGNEGGWNARLDAEFGRHDLQDRPVLHPDAVYGGVDATHYPSWEALRRSLEPRGWRSLWRRLVAGAPLVLPTEVLHGLYDGGHGAGLEDFWQLVRGSPRAAGLFLWTFVDEGVLRDDRGGVIDTFGNFAPDGIVGPFRQKEGSFWAVRAIWSPVAIVERRLETGRAAALRIESRYQVIGLGGSRFVWEWLRFPPPGGREETVLGRGEMPAPGLDPGESAWISIPPPPSAAEALRLRLVERSGREASVWVMPLARALEPSPVTRTVRRSASPVELGRREGAIVLSAAGSRVEIENQSATAGRVTVRRGEASLRLALAALDGAAPRVESVEEVRDAGARGLTLRYAEQEELREASWLLEPGGWLRLEYSFDLEEPRALGGVLLTGGLARARRLRWVGRGPYRVWGNRLRGPLLGLWEKEWNDTVTGVDWHYPEFKGFHAAVHWATVETAQEELTLRLDPEAVPYLGVLRPSFAEGVAPDGLNLARHTRPAVPADGLALLHGISAIGTKFHPATALGPQGEAALAPGSYRGGAWLRLEDSSAAAR